MATASECESDITLCPICLEQLNNPKYLPCLHTYCEGCIAEYITSSIKQDDIIFKCPVCRVPVKSEESFKTGEDWSRSLPINFLINGLIEKRKVQRSEKLCMSCERIDLKTETKAEFVCVECSDSLCDNCVKCHKVNKFCLNHTILSIGEIAKQESLLKTFKNFCKDHKNKELELFCSDHNVPCCSICVTVKHRTCESVQTIEEAASNFVTSEALRAIKREITKTQTDVEVTLENAKTEKQHLETTKEKQTKKFDDFWTSFEGQINEIKSARKNEFDKAIEAEIDSLETTIAENTNKMKTILDDKKILDVTSKEASDVQILIEAQKVNANIKEINTSKTKQESSSISLKIASDTSNVIDLISKLCVVDKVILYSWVKIDEEVLHESDSVDEFVGNFETTKNQKEYVLEDFCSDESVIDASCMSKATISCSSPPPPSSTGAFDYLTNKPDLKYNEKGMKAKSKWQNRLFDESEEMKTDCYEIFRKKESDSCDMKMPDKSPVCSYISKSYNTYVEPKCAGGQSKFARSMPKSPKKKSKK